MRFAYLALAMALLGLCGGCAGKDTGGKSYIGIDAYREESRRWKSAEDKDLRFGRYSTHRYAASPTGVSYAPMTTPYGKTYE